MKQAASLLLIATGLTIAIASLIVTREVSNGEFLGAWTALMLPLPFAPIASMALGFSGLSLRD